MDTKSPVKSLTVWSGVTSSVGGLAILISLCLNQFNIEAASSEIEIIIAACVSVVSGMLTIYGRYRATTVIQK